MSSRSSNTGAFAPGFRHGELSREAIHPLITVHPNAGTKYFYTLDGTFPSETPLYIRKAFHSR